MKNNFQSKAVPRGTRTIWRYLSALILLLTLAIGNVWAADITVTPPTPNNASNPFSTGLYVMSFSGTGSKLSSGAITTGTKGAVITINFQATKSDMYIKTITFNSLGNGTLSSDDGTFDGQVFTATGNKNSVNVVLTSGSGQKGTVKVTNVVVNTGTNVVETITFTGVDSGDGKKATFTSSAATSALSSITTDASAFSVSSGKLSWANGKKVILTAESNIKYVAFSIADGKMYDSFSAAETTYNSANYSWSGSSKTVTLTNGSGGGREIKGLYVIIDPVVKHHVTYSLGGDYGTTPTQADVAEGAKFTLHNGTTDITAPAGKKFDGWHDGTTKYAGGAEYTMGGDDVELTAQWADVYTVTYVPNNGILPAETMTDSNSPYMEDDEVTLLANAFTAPENKEFDAWVVTKTASGDPITVTAGKFTMPAEAVTVTATWKDACALDPTVSATTLGTTSYTTQVVNCAGISVLGSAGCTISEYGYVYGTTTAPTISDNKKALEGDYIVAGTAFAETTLSGLASNTKYYVRAFATNSHGTAYGDEISFTTLAPLGNVLVVAKNAGQTSDAITALRDNGFLVTVSTPNDSRDYTGIDLVVLDESLDGSLAQTSTSEASTIKGANIPILNLKAFFYTKTNRWNWGAPVNGTAKNEIANISAAYCNAQSHPIFDGLTITAGAIDLIDPAVASGNTLQGVTTNTLVEGKEGYTLATSGDGITFIHELTPAQRGVTDAKYLMVAISNNAKDNLSADGEKLIVNAAKYLIGSTAWEPIVVPTAAEVTATPSENYTEGNTITLTASATGTTASTTYTWYKGADWATASATTPVQAAATDGNVFTKTAALEDAGTYWCNISNGTSCDVQASVTITVSSASTPTHAISYDNTKGADMTAYPTEYTEGVGVASFAALADIAGWHFVEWSPASIAADATTDQTITAVWAQVFEVTFDLQGHGAAIAAQNIVSGGKVTKPDDPIAIGWDFGGWFTDADCTAGNEFDFNTPITVATPLFAKWVAFEGCTELWPATSGDALIAGAMVDLQTGSKGGSIKVANLGATGSIAYNANGLSFNNGGKDSVLVTLNNDLKNGSIIKVRLMANGGTKDNGRGLNLLNAARVKKALLGWQANEEVTSGDIREFTYTVVESDGFAGTNVFTLQRQNSVFLQSIKVEECGAAITYHNLTSEVNIAGKGIVTLGATSVREGYTTTAEYSDIDPLYEFVSWSVSGAGASVENATANPATITVGTEDAVVTLNLQLIPVKYTVNYFDGTTPMGTEQVAVNEHPTASEIETAKRHYTFLGWSLTDGGDIVALNTITRTEATTVDLFAKYEPVACPVSGTIFSMEFDETKKPGETVTIAKDASIDLAEYATISGGNAMIINGETSGKDAISTDGEFLLKATKEVMKVELNCVLQEGDIIRIPDNSAKLVISTSNAKTGTYQAFADKNTHEFAVTAAWAGVDDIYVLYDGSSLKFTKVYVIRPAKFDVSFNMMGHGTQIADIEDVIEGSKITAPTAPTDEDYSFAGWYKETTLENVWNFAEDVVTANTTLFAKWIDKSDATLKSLKYGETEIALEAGVYTYNVSLPAFTSAVPALTAETSNPNATKVIANAAAFDSEGNATSTVTVTPEVGADQVYYVNFAKGVEIPLQDVTGSITWNFANAVTANVSITGTPQVLANYGGVTNDNTFESDKLEASGEKFTAGSNANLRANYIRFHTTVPGILSISYSNTGGSNPARYIYVNGVKYDEEGSASTTKKGLDNKVFVPAGDVELVMKDGEDVSKNVQIYQMIFNATPDYTRPVTEGRYGTICLPTNGVMIGTTIYTLAFYGATSQKIFFDEVVTGRMEAGKPYLFLPEQGVTELKVFYTDSETKAAQTVNGFHGYIGDSEDPEDALPVPAGEGNYIVQNNTYREVQAGATAYILSHRAYIHFDGISTTEPAKAPGARRIGLGKDAAQGFENLQSGDQPMKVMIDGTLYIIRGEKVYNANGQVVK